MPHPNAINANLRLVLDGESERVYDKRECARDKEKEKRIGETFSLFPSSFFCSFSFRYFRQTMRSIFRIL